MPDTPQTPADRARTALERALGVPWERALRHGWERVGQVVVLQFLDGVAEDDRRRAAAAVGPALGAVAVVEDAGVRGGPTRTPEARHLWGGPTRTVHRENGVQFALDPQRVMFSSGNQAERARMAGLDCAGETVVDLFAGVGYLCLPIAVHAHAARVVACEVNPAAHEFLVENIRLNGVGPTVEPRLGDCRDVAPRGAADRVLMGYVHGTEAFVATAIECLRPGGGVLHYHEAYPQETKFADGLRALRTAARDRWRVEVLGQREVKSFAPGIDHICIDARLVPVR